MEIHYNGMEVDFGMQLRDMKLNVEWQSITLDNAEIIPFVEMKRDLDQQVVLNYFNWAFKLIVPWIAYQQPENVSRFSVPSHFDGILDISNLSMDVYDNYLSFGMDPHFLFGN